MSNVYSKLKIFHFPEKLASLPASASQILPPLQIRLKPTNVCNHSCSYCAYHSDTLQLGKDMEYRDAIPHEKMKEIIQDIIEMGVKAVTFSGGGEPTIYPHLLESLIRLAEADVHFASLTNGSRIQGELAKIFASHGTWLRISIDGWDAKSYSEYRSVGPNEFGKVIGNMEHFMSLGGVCRLSVIINVDQHNAAHVYELIHTLVNVGVRTMKVAPVIQSNDGRINHAYHQPYVELVNEQVQRAHADYPELELYNTYGHQEMTFEKDYHWCPFIQIRPVIGADLNVYACHDKAYNLETGLLFSIKDQSFKNGWFADKAQFFKIDPSRVCNHHCMVDENNQLVLDFLDTDKDHLRFV